LGEERLLGLLELRELEEGEEWCGILVIWKGAHPCEDDADERW
jgi:hypothetical protein